MNALAISQTHGDQYRKTPPEIIQQYIDELEESKADKASGRRTTSKSKVMDIHHTFSEIKTAVS